MTSLSGNGASPRGSFSLDGEDLNRAMSSNLSGIVLASYILAFHTNLPKSAYVWLQLH